MANKFGADILIQEQYPKNAALFYVQQLGFAITDEKPDLIGLHGEHINFFIERDPALAPVLEVTVERVPRCYVKDPFGLIDNLTSLSHAR